MNSYENIFHALTLLDLLILLISGGGVLFGLYRGFIRDAFSLAAWFLSFYVLAHFHGEIMSWWHMQDLPYGQFIVPVGIFVITLIVFNALGVLLSHLIRHISLMWLDIILGMASGCFRGLLFSMILITALEHTQMVDKRFFQASILRSHVVEFFAAISPFIPNEVLELWHQFQKAKLPENSKLEGKK